MQSKNKMVRNGSNHLVYFGYHINIRSGGPSGYIANLRLGVSKLNILDIDFFDVQDVNYGYIIRTLKKFKKSILKRIYRITSGEKYYEKMLLDDFLHRKLPVPDNMWQYSSIHFHSTSDLYLFYKYHRDLLVGKRIFLTSHSPQLPSEEIFDLFKENGLFQKHILDEYVKFMYHVDIEAFKIPDYIIFPSNESVEPYVLDKDVQEILASKKLNFLLTGCNELSINIQRDEYRKLYGVGLDEFVVGYIGRHNSVKGYDILKSVALLDTLGDTRFLIAGDEYPLTGLDVGNWTEVGKISGVGDFLNAIDLLVVPNRQTYFDLIVVEALSVGTPLLMSYTGGNKYFEECSQGIKFVYDFLNPESWANLILQIKKDYVNNKDAMKKSNLKLYNNFFTVNKFANDYNTLINKLKSDSN